MKLSPVELKNQLEALIPQDSKPIVVYSGLWYIARAIDAPTKEIPALINRILIEIAKGRTLVMPTYTDGFQDGTLNLDTEPSLTGVITEEFRLLPDAKRTASAFFSYAAIGPEADALSNLRPKDIWGDDSIFSWMEEQDAHLLMIGAPWDACSLKHRAEWLENIPYRYRKSFEGQLTLNTKTFSFTDTLFVRSLDPFVDNVWHGIHELFSEYGMNSVSVGSGQFAHMSSQKLIEAMRSKLKSNPYCFTQDPEKVSTYFSGKSDTESN